MRQISHFICRITRFSDIKSFSRLVADIALIGKNLCPLSFVEVVETEIMNLHEGNIARYRIRAAEYRAWRQGWR